MDAGILRALKTVKDNRYVQYVGLGLAGLVEQEDQVDKETGKRKRKSKYQLIRISAAVCGIELCYAAETAFVSPILLKLGVPASLMTMVWCLSPIVGFFLVPVMGSLSDRCRLKIGRRRPFIIILSIGIIFGLALVPNGQIFGVFLGDTWNKSPLLPETSSSVQPLQTSTAATRADIVTTASQKDSDFIFLRKPKSKIKQFSVTHSDDTDKSNQSTNATPSSLLSQLSSPVTMSLSSSSPPFKNFEEIDLPTEGKLSSNYFYNNYNSKQSLSKLSHMQPPRKREITKNNSTTNYNNTQDEQPLLSFSVSSEHLRGIILTILGVALLDFNCDACQSPCRAYLLDVSVPEDHSQGLTMFTVMAGAGGAVGYVMGGIDWNSTKFGEAFGGHIRVVFTIVLVAFLVCMTSTLTSFKEIPLAELNLAEENLQSKKKKKDKKKYRKFINEEDSSTEDDDETSTRNPMQSNYGALCDTGKQQHIFVNNINENEKYGTDFNQIRANMNHKKSICDVPSQDQHFTVTDKQALTNHKTFTSCNGSMLSEDKSNNLTLGDNNPFNQNSYTNNPSGENWSSQKTLENGVHVNGKVCNISNNKTHQLLNTHSCSIDSDGTKEISPYSMRGDINNKNDDVMPTVDLLEVSTDVTLRTYLQSIVRMPRCMWILCLTNLFCWMSLVCYSLYFTDFVGQAVFRGNPHSPVGSVEHNLYDEGIRLGSMGMSLYSLSCACYSLVIEKLVQRFRAKRVYVIGQLVYTVGMLVMSASRSKVAVILMSPTAGVMYATLFTMPYLVVAHYHARGMFSQSDTLGGEERQVRGLGTDVAIISSMVFLAQFLLSVFMGTAVSVLRSTTTVVVASSVLSLMGAITATQITYLDL